MKRAGRGIRPARRPYARDDLHVDYVFWSTEEPFYLRDVLPYLREAGSR